MKAKIFSILIICLALLFALVGCGSSDTDTDTNTDAGTDSNLDTGAPDSGSDAKTTYTVSFSFEGVLIDTVTANEGDKIVAPVITLVKDGYSAGPWKNGDEPWDFEDIVSENLNLSSSWVANQNTIKFDTCGGFGTVLDMTLTTDTVGALPFASLMMTGYTFSGWSTTKGGEVEYANGATYKMGPQSEVTLYAVWTANENKLYFDGNGADNSMSSITIPSNSSANLPISTLTRQDYRFIGWAKTPYGGVSYNDGAEYKMGTSSHQTLYAVWELVQPVSETINLITNGTSNYVIVYDDSNPVCEAFATDLASHIKTKYGVTLECKKGGASSISEYEIIIGNARDATKFTKAKINDFNDFAIDVCKNDLIIHTESPYMYDYLFTIVKDAVFNGDSQDLTLAPDDSIIYQSSEYASMNYAEYLKKTTGNYDYNKLAKIFKADSYTDYDETTIPYRIYIPSSYDPTNPLPVLTILHGAGERGDDNISQLKNLVSRLFNQENSPYTDAIIICPQCPSWPNQWVDTPWENGNYSVDSVAESNELTAVVELLGFVQGVYSTDATRYYIMGLSMGGFGTYDMLMRHSNMFAAGVVMCGCADVSKASELANIPIYAVHGTNDTTTVPYSEAKELADAIESITDNKFTFETLQGYGHNVWDYVGDSTEIAQWLFAQ